MTSASSSESPSQDPGARKTSLPVTVKFFGMPRSHPPVKGRTKKVSRAWLSVELQATTNHGISLPSNGGNQVALIPFVVLTEKAVGVSATIPGDGRGISALGRVVWFDFGSRGEAHYFTVGVLLEARTRDDRHRWEVFASNHEARTV